MAHYCGRRSASIENDHLRVTVLEEGGHIAEILEKETGINPLWNPPWKSIEPSSYGPHVHADYGAGAEGQLLAGIMGHNLCLDVFGVPSNEEAASGLTVHGEGSIVPYALDVTGNTLTQRAHFPIAQMRFTREIALHGNAARIRETVESTAVFDRPIGWTQHVTLGPPFLEKGKTAFRASATKSRVFEGKFGDGDYLREGADFDWPNAPRKDGGTADLQVMTDAPASGAFTTHLMDPRREDAYFVAFTPSAGLAFGYIWRQSDFPWMGIWEENFSRTHVPWNGNALARGMEFGVSPMPETRRQMVDRSKLFGVPAYRWLPAKARLDAEYWVIAKRTSSVPETLGRPVLR